MQSHHEGSGPHPNKFFIYLFFYFEGTGFNGALEDVPGKYDYIDAGYASIAARNPSYATVGDATTGYAMTKNLENGAGEGLYPAVRLGENPSTERCLDGAAAWKSVDTPEKHKHLTRAIMKDVGPAARGGMNHSNAFEMGVFSDEEPNGDEQHVYCEIPYGLKPH